MRSVSKAAMVALAVSGLLSAASGVGMAESSGRGARATGGDGAGQVTQQNAAQEGRQNNSCADPGDINPLQGEAEARCLTVDKSKMLFSKVRGGGAKAKGGDSYLGSMFQRNTAQEGKQNNHCGNPNRVSIYDSAEVDCLALDKSVSKKTYTSGRGAKAEGGDGVYTVDQQNTAQEGRQNNNCGNPNLVTFNDSTKAKCVLVDKSVSKNTRTRGGGAKAEGGDSLGELFQQNTAQEGRQNNNCGNPNNATLSGPTEVTCVAVDESVEIDHPKKKHHGKKHHGKKHHGKKHHGKKHQGKKYGHR
ncbi:hypothetical protein [Streptomyces meridianus]|uniref:Uncharacterized protein n=1 Tax=Streptomyces meridianus TaxID=2938945 RepID=A0ABT0X933_9ACTN|nr:hypothetical protein [Streptomyces meridianus]MCM2579038.1 hypothetical protein [Streptomyces meridianus]